MIKVITYGTYDMLHYGHIKLLERAKALGDYLIVGVTSDDYDQSRGKINNQQSLIERIKAVKDTGLADEIIVEEYEGQKIDDIRRCGVDIFTVGSDWKGKFDYLSEYCKVVYLDRTQGISSSKIRSNDREVRIGLVGNEETRILNKYCDEFIYVNGAELSGLCTKNDDLKTQIGSKVSFVTDDYCALLDKSDAVYLISHPSDHYKQIKLALEKGKHVLVESPIALSKKECAVLQTIANKKGFVLMDAIKTAYSTAYNRLLLLIKSGIIGKVVSVDTTCTSIRNITELQPEQAINAWNSITSWGPTGLLPIFQILGTDIRDIRLSSLYTDESQKYDSFTKIDISYEHAIASSMVGRGVKSEGDMVVSGTKGYIYVPAPWWKTDYFEVRFEDVTSNRRYFYQLEGEGIRYEIVAFVKAIQNGVNNSYVDDSVSQAISRVMELFYEGKAERL